MAFWVLKPFGTFEKHTTGLFRTKGTVQNREVSERRDSTVFIVRIL